MYKILLTVVATFLATTAQTQQAPQNPNTFGRWEFNSEAGMSGTVTLENGYCHFQVISSFSSLQTRCFSIWNPETNRLSIVPWPDAQGRNQRPFTVPDYQPAQNSNVATQTLHSVGDASYAFELTTFGRKFMSGHLLGAGKHDTVTLRRH